MKLLIAGDLHFNIEHFAFLQEKFRECDALCLLGDYLDENKGNRSQQQLWISDWVRSIEKPVFMCSGNHDIDENGECEWLDSLACSSIATDNNIRTMEGLRIGVMPYLGLDISKFYDCDVLICHVPPSNTATSIQKGKDWGDTSLYGLLHHKIITPKYLFSGHVERPDANEDKIHTTKIINPGADHHSKSPCFAVLNTRGGSFTFG